MIKFYRVVAAAAFCWIGLSEVLTAQNNVGIGTTTPDASSILEMQSTTQGVLVPRMQAVARIAIAAPANGLLVYDLDSMCFFYYKAGIWTNLCGGGGSGTGPTGATGAAGPAGAAGPTGVAGTNGANGATGIHCWDLNGNNINDASEDINLDGNWDALDCIGATGNAGVNGATGAAGPTGVTGINGSTGTTGATGLTGNNGATGVTGAAGPTGAAGINGTNGVTGATGPAGPTGATGFGIGPTGPTGANGSTGAAGTNGTNGATGAAGPTGTAGATGAAGPTGVTGTAGATGSTGAVGTAGANGATGATGANGTNGTNGATGATGAAGAAGANGATGPTGAAGATGTAGAAGATGPTGPTWTLTTPTFNANGTLTVNGTAGSGGPVTTTTQAWLVGGNTLAGTGAFGTISNNHVDLISNNLVRGRLSNLGEFFIGTTNTTLAGDLMNGVSNATFPWAVNGYSGFNGGGVYGSITGGTTAFAGVQGEYNSPSVVVFNTAAVRGLNATASPGTGFRNLAATGPQTGINGSTTAGAGSFMFGVYGSYSSGSIRCGAVFGDDFGVAAGALGYYASTAVDYGVYGFGSAYQTGTFAGRLSNNNDPFSAGVTEGWDGQNNNTIGFGSYGGVMGGWVRGMAYGMNVKGVRYSMYVDGYSYTNKPTAQLINPDNGSTDRIPAYTSTSMTSDVSSRGKVQMINGEAHVAFDANFSAIITDPSDLVITVTPTGNSNGVYVSSVDANGFVVKENNNGSASVQLSWTAIATIKGQEQLTVPSEVLATDFDGKMQGVMFNDNNTTDTPQPLWWDGTQIRFDAPPAKQPNSDAVANARPQTEVPETTETPAQRNTNLPQQSAPVPQRTPQPNPVPRATQPAPAQAPANRPR
ncbi:MAG: hypothetical protein ABIQ40_06065 [Bacteroidia bacterium]